MKGCKRRPPANRHSKESSEAKKMRLNDPKEYAKQLSLSSPFDRLPSACVDSQVGDTPELPSAGATPTTSKERLLNLNKVVREAVETDSETEEVCTSDSVEG